MVTLGFLRFTKESIIEKTYGCENLPQPLFAKEGEFPPFVKGGKEGFGFRCPHNYGLISNSSISGYLPLSKLLTLSFVIVVIKKLDRAIEKV